MSGKSEALPDPKWIARQAAEMLKRGAVGDPQLTKSGQAGPPWLVSTPDHEPHSWLIPVTVGDRFAAFFQFLLDGTLMRFSMFYQRPGDYRKCPIVMEWFDLPGLREKAANHCWPGESAEEPFLTFDRSPDRVVWALPLRGPEGRIRLFFVAGDTIYSPPPPDTFG